MKKVIFLLFIASFVWCINFVPKAFAVSFSIDSVSEYDYPYLEAIRPRGTVSKIDNGRVIGTVTEKFWYAARRIYHDRRRGFVLDLSSGNVEYLPVIHPNAPYYYEPYGIKGDKVVGFRTDNVGFVYNLSTGEENNALNPDRNAYPYGRVYLTDVWDVQGKYVGYLSYSKSHRTYEIGAIAECSGYPCEGEAGCPCDRWLNVNVFDDISGRIIIKAVDGDIFVGSRYGGYSSFLYNTVTGDYEIFDRNNFPEQVNRVFFKDISNGIVVGYAQKLYVNNGVYPFIFYDDDFYLLDQNLIRNYGYPISIDGRDVLFNSENKIYVGHLKAEGLVPEPPSVFLLFLGLFVFLPLLKKISFPN